MLTIQFLGSKYCKIFPEDYGISEFIAKFAVPKIG